METQLPILISPSAPILPKPRSRSRSPSRSPTRARITDDILSDLSPDTTLDSFTNASGALRASIEAASPAQRAFGIRAAIASKKIQEWVGELAGWPWPDDRGFEVPAAKRRRIDEWEREGRKNGDAQTVAKTRVNRHVEGEEGDEEYWGSLPAHDVVQYENRIEDILEDMDDLNVEEIKSQVLNTHVLPEASPSGPSATVRAAYTRMDDFTAVVTATVLKALPNLSKLMALMDIWSVRLLILRQIPLLLVSLHDAEMALKSGWNTLDKIPTPTGVDEEPTLSRENYNIMREILQDKVTVLGQKIDSMLDALEGRKDTIPDAWLDRMEAIEQDYGEWTVSGDRKVREGEWARDAVMRRSLRLPVIEEDEVPISQPGEQKVIENADGQLKEDKEEAPSSLSVLEDRTPVKEEPKPDVRLPENSAGTSRNEDQLSPFSTAEHISLGSPLSPITTVSQFDGARDKEPSTIPLETLTPERSFLINSTSNLPEHVLASDAPNLQLPPIDLMNEVNKTDIHQEHIFTPSDFQSRAAISDGAAQIKGMNSDEKFGTEPQSSPTPAIPRPSTTSTTVETHNQVERVAVGEEDEETEMPHTPAKVPRFGHGFANLLRASNFQSPPRSESRSRPTTPRDKPNPILEDDTVQKQSTPPPITEIAPRSVESKSVKHVDLVTETAPLDEISHPREGNQSLQPQESGPEEERLPLLTQRDIALPTLQLAPPSHQSHSRQVSTSSTVSGYSASDPSPEICEAAQEYFSPVVSPIRQSHDYGNATPTREPVQDMQSRLINEERPETPRPYKQLTEVDNTDTQPLSMSPPLPENTSGRPSTAIQTLSRDQTPDLSVEPQFPTMNEKSYTDYDQSPSLGRVRIYGEGEDYSPPSSPPAIPIMSNRRSLHVQVDPYDAESLSSESPLTPSDSSFLSNLDLSLAPLSTLPTKVSDDQLQQQISEILESILARIHLTSEPIAVSQSELRPSKQRPSLNSNSTLRPHSRTSSRPQSRAATPSFTLAPVQSARRSRPQPGAPEIKVYHLSRSTGEAPIKLFVRLVGENGERVMVRVGGGWADLGEYLKEYASHHGRRPDPKGGKVEIQDLPSSRSVSSSSIASVGTVRNGNGDGNGNGNGASSPIMRPGSSLERPGSGLAMRKTRRSFGADDSPQGQGGFGNSYRSPSTPLPNRVAPLSRQVSTNSTFETPPPSASTYTPPARSSSRLSWTEEDSSLGLAGPKSRKVEISAENAAWVESMKEKVRMASAEKDRERERRASGGAAPAGEFGDMGKVGGTKRLFIKKGGGGGVSGN